MQPLVRPLLACLVLAASAPAQDYKYENKELGLRFDGVYGWTKRTAAESGAWTELASYTESAYDAAVRLLVRDNPYETLAELRSALEEEFKAGAGAEDQPAFKEVQIREARMNEGIELPAIEVEAVVTRTIEGKKREHLLLVRTYHGANRLFRVHCSVKRSRARKVRDLLERAVSGVVVEATDERVTRGTPFYSRRGRYACLVPEAFRTVLPYKRSYDVYFEHEERGITIQVYAYAYDGILADHVEEMLDFYRDAIKIENERANVMGGEGFVAKITKDKRVTFVTGTVKGSRVYRVHTSAPADKADDAQRTHAWFLEGFRTG